MACETVILGSGASQTVGVTDFADAVVGVGHSGCVCFTVSCTGVVGSTINKEEFPVETGETVGGGILASLTLTGSGSRAVFALGIG